MSKMGMTAEYALGVLRTSREGSRPEVDWLTNADGSHPTREEAIEWLETLDPDFDIVNGEKAKQPTKKRRKRSREEEVPEELARLLKF